MCCTRLAENTGRKNRQKSPSGHHRTTLSGYIFATKACIDNRKKVLNSNIFSTSSHNIANFGPLSYWRLRSVGEFGEPQQISTGFASWLCYSPTSLNGGQQRKQVPDSGSGDWECLTAECATLMAWYGQQATTCVSLRLERSSLPDTAALCCGDIGGL